MSGVLESDGGGVYECTLYSCMLSGNSAEGMTSKGGGAAYSTLNNCTLSGNSANWWGGGVYRGRLDNCMLSGNWADVGGGASDSTLSNCTLSSNSARVGGGASGSTLSNCVVTNNVAYSYGMGGGLSFSTAYGCTVIDNEALAESLLYPSMGGGAYASSLYNCMLHGNSAAQGGGASASSYWETYPTESTLYNCTLSRNSATWGGGTYGDGCPCRLYNCTVVDNLAYDSGGGVVYSTVANCIVAYNAAWTDPNYSDSTFDYCCTSPLPTNGLGNITLPPLFADYVNGNLRLQSNSPCINSGNYAYATTTTDLDGNPRIVGGRVDMGAYEYTGGSTSDSVPWAWLLQYGLSTDGSADYVDADHDGMNNWQEWICGTCPTNAQSALRMVSALPTSTNASVTWQSVAGMNYFLERSGNLGPPFTLLATDVLGQAGTTTYADTNAAGAGPFFYRVGVQCP